MLVVKFDSSGTVSWIKTYGTSGYDNVVHIARVSTGYLVCGNTASFGWNGATDAIIIKID